jgi:hypothetical protein
MKNTIDRRTFLISSSAAAAALGFFGQCKKKPETEEAGAISDELIGSAHYISNGHIKLQLDMEKGYFSIELQENQKNVFNRATTSFEMLNGKIIKSFDFSEHHIIKKEISDCWGRGIAFQFVHEGGIEDYSLIQHFRFYENRPFFHLSTEVVNSGHGKLCLKNIKLLDKCEVTQNSVLAPLENDIWMFRNGFERPSDPHCFVKIDFDPKEEEIKKENSDWEVWRWLQRDKEAIRYLSETVVLLKNLNQNESLLLGFVSQADHCCKHWIESGEKQDIKKITISSESRMINYTLVSGKSLFSETLQVNCGCNGQEMLDTFITSVAAKKTPIVREEPLIGWSSWQYYRREISEKDVLENVKYLSEKKIPVEYILIDDGYSVTRGDWLEHNENFPSGMKTLASKIKDAGFKPGIWIAPFTTINNSRLAKENPGWFLKNALGELVQKRTHLGSVYTLDFTVKAARDWLRNLIRVIAKEWDYKWIKLDGPLVSYYEGGVFAGENITPVEHIRMGMEIIRQEAGDEVIIEGEGYYGPAIGLADTQRVTQDIQQRWEQLRHCCQANLMATYMHKRLWINNPDAFILRDSPSPYNKDIFGDGLDEEIMSIDEARMMITALGLTGGVVMLTDKMGVLSKERERMIRSFLPVYTNAARPVDWFNGHKASQLFHLPVDNGQDKWDVLGAFFWYEDVDELSLNLADIGLDPGKSYHVFEYWSQKYLGIIKDRLTVTKKAPHTVQLFCIREDTGSPQFLSANLHITQDCLNLKNYRYIEKTRTMGFSIACFNQKKARLFIYTPENLKVKHVRTDADTMTNRLEGNMFVIDYDSNNHTIFEIDFESI